MSTDSYIAEMLEAVAACSDEQLQRHQTRRWITEPFDAHDIRTAML